MGKTTLKMIDDRMIDAVRSLRLAAEYQHFASNRCKELREMLPELSENHLHDMVYNDSSPAELMVMTPEQLADVINEKIATCGNAIDPVIDQELEDREGP